VIEGVEDTEPPTTTEATNIKKVKLRVRKPEEEYENSGNDEDKDKDKNGDDGVSEHESDWESRKWTSSQRRAKQRKRVISARMVTSDEEDDIPEEEDWPTIPSRRPCEACALAVSPCRAFEMQSQGQQRYACQHCKWLKKGCSRMLAQRKELMALMEMRRWASRRRCNEKDDDDEDDDDEDDDDEDDEDLVKQKGKKRQRTRSVGGSASRRREEKRKRVKLETSGDEGQDEDCWSERHQE